MKYLIMFALLALFSHAFAQLTPQQLVEQGYKRYDVEQGTITYQLGGNVEGTETIYFTHWGWREAKYTSQTIAITGTPVKEHKLVILDGENMYNINLEEKKGVKMPNKMLMALMQDADSKSLAAMGEKMMEEMGANRLEKEVLIGKECQVWSVPSIQGKVWVWQGLTLKTHARMSSIEILTEATMLDLNTAIPNEKFELPEGIELNDLTPTNDK